MLPANTDTSLGVEPLTVVMIIESAGGGSGRHVIDLATKLTARGHRVHLLYSPLRAEPSFLDRISTLKGIPIHAIPMRREPHPSDLRALLRVKRYVAQIGGADVLHGHSSKAGALVRLARTVGLQGVRVYTPHGFRTMDPFLGRAARTFFGILEKSLSRHGCDALITVSPEERDHAIGLGVPAHITHVVVNAIPMTPSSDRSTARLRLKLDPEELCIGFVGRFVHAKAPERVIDAVAPFAARYPRLKVVLIGDGPDEALVRRRILEAGMRDRVMLPGPLPGSEAMPAFDILAVPSRHEAMPYVLLEGLAAGLPIVATDVGGASLAVRHGGNGFICAQSDMTQFSRCIEAVVRDSTLRRTMSRLSVRQRSLFSFEAMIDSTLAAYRAAAKNTRTTASSTHASSF